MAQEAGDLRRTAPQGHGAIDHVATQLEERAAGVAGLDLSSLRATVGIHRGAHEVDVAEPAFACGVERGADAFVEAVVVAQLQDALVGFGLVDEFLERLEVGRWGLLEMKVASGVENLVAPGNRLPDFALDDDHVERVVGEKVVFGNPLETREALLALDAFLQCFVMFVDRD